MVDHDVIDCLDRALAKRQRHGRVDTAEMPDNALKALAVPCEQRAKKVVAFVNNQLPPDKRRDIHVFFCEDEQYGAFTICDQYNYIVLNIGIILRLLHFCERMMENPQLWPDVRTEAFQAFSVAVTFECFDLIVRHEVAHLILGHLAKDVQDATKINPRVSQVLEFVADGHAAFWGYEALGRVADIAYTHRSKAAEGYREFHRTRADALANYILSLFFAFRIMDEAIPGTAEMATASHAPASFRFNVACIHLGENFKLIGDTEAHDQLVRADTWERGEAIFATLLDRLPDKEIKHWTMSDQSERHYNQISDLAKTLPPHLLGLAD